MERSTGAKYMLVTGASRGIGGGLAEALAQQAVHHGGANVVNFGNASGDIVRGNLVRQGKDDRFPQVMNGDHVQFVDGVDFREPGALEEALQSELLKIREVEGARIVQVLYSAGVAQLEGSGLRGAMYDVNTRAPIEMARAVRDSGLASDDANFLYVSSLAADRKGRRVPGLEGYTYSKWAGLEGVQNVWTAGSDCRRRVSVLLPGVFDSDMADEIIESEKAPLEFFGAPLASTDPDNPMMRAVADAIINGRVPDEMKFPRLSRWYVKLASVERQKTLLPLLIKVFARSVLNAKGQTPEDHDRRIAYHKENKTYGDNFPYDDLVYKNLWSGSIGKNMERALKFLGVV